MGLLPGHHSFMSGSGNMGELNISEVIVPSQLTLQ